MISKKKIHYPVQEGLRQLLHDIDRTAPLPIEYEQLLRYDNSVSLYNRDNEDTLWLSVSYPSYEKQEVDAALLHIHNSTIYSRSSLNFIVLLLYIHFILWCSRQIELDFHQDSRSQSYTFHHLQENYPNYSELRILYHCSQQSVRHDAHQVSLRRECGVSCLTGFLHRTQCQPS